MNVSPSWTTTYTISASNQAGSTTQTTTLSVNSTPAGGGYFSVGPGFSDVVPHQLVRTASDLLYVFAARPYSTTLAAYWTAGPGLPAASSAFSRATQRSLSATPISISPAYDGRSIVYVTANLLNGRIVVIPFDLSSNTFGPEQVVAQDAATVSGDYIGTSGISSMIDQTSTLHIAYWSSANQIVHVALTPNGGGSLGVVSGPVRVDASGSARHPSIAVSPLDNSVTIGWVSLATTPRRILARVRNASGQWSTVENVSSASFDVWTSNAAGIDIDQGPSLVITTDGVKHLTYIENYDASGDYGAVHYVTNSGGAWTDVKVPATYSHDPVVATNSANEVYIIGHGHPNDTAQACKSMDDICVSRRNPDGIWAAPTLFAAHPPNASYDASPSVKWSVVGWNRPETIEFVFFETPYTAPTLLYGRLP